LLSVVTDLPRTVRATGEVSVSLVEALRAVHEPPADADVALLNQQKSAYHQRIVYDEFFYLELAMLSKRAASEQKKSYSITDGATLVKRALELLPFQLTEGQTSSLAEIQADFASGHPMNRLLQGDVGSGKTMVAFLSSLMAIAGGWQVALMVPTEILAEQHFKNLVRFETDLGIRMELLTSSTSDKRRREILEDLAAGKIGLMIGTHALLTPDVVFNNLAYVIIDEQHRFGVMQRAQLRHKVKHQEDAREPHLLFMTATPIPRTLSMSVYGDLTVSIIKHRPAGRQPIKTKVYYDKQRPQAYKFIQTELKKGRQAYFIYPLVEESEKLDLRDATLMHKELCGVFEGYEVGLLHGRMKSAEKEHVMGRFKAGEIQVLVSTTVVEVGVDVPNATVMVIEHAERFGLSQLHQLRGRVGRGKEQSHCILMAGYAQSEDTRYRLSVMAETDDGFVIAEEDLKLRGPGDFLGTKQSGLPDFHLAHLIRDGHLLQAARKRAEEILQEDPQLMRAENQSIRSVMHERWEKRLDLTHV
jgi:ATP-dependent DNA helicase RecG